MRIKLISALGALALACPSPSLSEPLTIETLLGLESFGRIDIDPSGSVAVFEERRARGDLPRYDLQPEGALRYARLYRFNVDTPSEIRPLLPMDDGAGYTMGPFSPDGSRLVVFRLQDLTFRLGIVDLRAGAVAWSDLSPESGAWGRSVQWISNVELLVLGMPDGALPPRLAMQNATQRRLPDLWAQAARGEPAFVSVGQGAAAEVRETRRLWRVHANTGAAVVLSEGDFLDFEASPDGKHVAVLRDGPLAPPPGLDVSTEFRRARSLRLVDTVTGRSIDPPETADISTSLLGWSANSSELLVASIGPAPARLLSVTPSGEVRDRTPTGVAPDTTPDVFGSPTAHAAWLGEGAVVRGTRDGRLGWWAQRGTEAVLANSLSEGGRVLAQGQDAALIEDHGRVLRLRHNLSAEDLGPTGNLARLSGILGHRRATDPMGAVQAEIVGDGGQLCRVFADALPAPSPCVDAAPGASVSWDRQISVGIGAEGRASNRLEVRSALGSEIVRRLNPELDTVYVPQGRLITGPNGARGWVYLPETTTQPPPVVVIPYPGKTYPTAPRAMTPEAVQMTLNGGLLVAAGYAVIYPDLPANAEPSAGLADRILAVVDAAAVDGSIDADRIGLWGHSFGGWSVVMSAAQSERFKAVIAVNGAYNLPLSLSAMSPHQRMQGDNTIDAISGARWLETGQAGMLQSFWSDPERYRRGSPFEAADRIAAPVLLFHGELDFLGAHAEQMYAALVRLRKPAALTYLFGEDHSIHNPGNARIYYEQVIDWFDRYLKPETPRSSPAIAAATPPSTPG
ncbi:MAG TPA: prolyl oligopeptidase family serine peptidase [Brevundimonas sp.]|uniref:S9 family peptidase n=1 Tax=Brevundimonas sp. TaxID=1871086 RepID=UPI0026335427|nr:prolyl oligopeptidase family serine peptidase [Brevundimonas sp.]HRO32001.1 prolyl oligopeptidase family serine peptidase [Brevundimonas sp.]